MSERRPGHPVPGGSTAIGGIVDYRLAKLRGLGVLDGRWLDCGCADGGYTQALVESGADSAVGIDPDGERVAAARRLRSGPVEFEVAGGEGLPFETGSFDGVLLNEVLEHVDDERATLAEVARVLRPGGSLALFSPNRFFPFEGHGAQIGKRVLDFPVPLMPWLPEALTAPALRARNYWPWQLSRLVRDSGLHVSHLSSAFPQFELYKWVPDAVAAAYRRSLPVIERLPLVRWLGVSVLVVARKVS